MGKPTNECEKKGVRLERRYKEEYEDESGLDEIYRGIKDRERDDGG